MSEFTIIRDYPHSVRKVWAALTDPELMPLWTSTGRGGRPEGFVAEPGTRFRLIGKPTIGWDGTVDCEVLAARSPTLLSYTWRNGQDSTSSLVTNRLDTTAGGTRLHYEHTNFSGPGGFVMSKLLGAVRRKMLSVGLPALLDDLDDDGNLKPGSTLKARPLS